MTRRGESTPTDGACQKVEMGGRIASHSKRRGELTPTVGAFYEGVLLLAQTLETAIIIIMI